MLHGLDLTTSETARRPGSEAELLSQSKRRPCRGASRVAGPLRVRKHPAGPKRQNAEVGDAPARESPRPRDPALRALSTSVRQTARLRALLSRLSNAGGRSSSDESRADRDRRARSGHEPERQAAIQRGRNTRQLRQGEGIVCASGNGGITRSSDLHEWRNDLGAVSTRDPVKL